MEANSAGAANLGGPQEYVLFHQVHNSCKLLNLFKPFSSDINQSQCFFFFLGMVSVMSTPRLIWSLPPNHNNSDTRVYMIHISYQSKLDTWSTIDKTYPINIRLEEEFFISKTSKNILGIRKSCVACSWMMMMYKSNWHGGMSKLRTCNVSAAETFFVSGDN